MAHAAIIEQLGDTGEVATALSRSTGQDFQASQVSNWKARGIPWRWRSEIRKLAEEKQIALPDGF